MGELLVLETELVSDIYNVDPTRNVFTSSCANGSSEIDTVIIDAPSLFTAWTSQFGKTIFLNDQSVTSGDGSAAMPLARQLAKSIGGLNSENVVASTGDFNKSFTLGGNTLTEWGTNCTTDPGNDYRGPDNNLYGSVADQGCKYLNGTAAIRPPHYYRPSTNSIMSDLPTTMPVIPDGTDNSKFNIVGCGWIVAGLDGQALTQANAATHFAECSNLDVAGRTDLPVVSTSPVVITVGGFSVGGVIAVANSIFGWTDIFRWMDQILPPEVTSIHVPTNANSTASLTTTVVQDVNNALAQGRPVIVVGYSLGSLVAFNIQNDFPGRNVQFIFVDPPYQYSPFFAGFASVFNRGLYSSAVTAVKNGIATDPRSLIWTNGEGISNMKHHDPFYYQDSSIAPNNLSNITNLNNLQDVILADLGKASTSTTSFSPIANATPSSPSVVLTGIESGGNLVTSIAPGDTVSLTGTGFDPNANDIHIEDVNDPTVYYDFYSYAPDANGNLTFTLPPYFDLSDSGGAPDTIPDTYFIQVAGYSSNWSNIGTVQVTATSVPPPVPGAITNDPTTPNQYILAGSGFSATGNSVGLTAQSVALTTPTTGSFNLASALGGFLQSVGSFFTGNTTHKQISVASIPATQKPTATNTKTTKTTTATKTTSKTASTVVTSSVVTKTATVKTATATVSTPDYVITGLPSSGSGVTFQIPGGMANGVYSVSVRSLNTPWVTTSNSIAVSNNLSGVGATSIGTASSTYTCPTGYVLSGSTCNPNLTPVSPSATAGTIQNAGSVRLSWTNPVYAASATGISIESASSASGPFSVIGTVSAIANTYTDTGISPSQTKYYRIQTMFSGNLYGPYTGVVSAVTPGLPNTPVLTATAISGSASINLTWTGGPDQFYVYNTSLTFPIASTTAKVYVVKDLSANTNYCFNITAYNNSLYASSVSNTACATTDSFVASQPGATHSAIVVSNIVASTSQAERINLSWNNNTVYSCVWNSASCPLPSKYTISQIVVQRALASTKNFSTIDTVAGGWSIIQEQVGKVSGRVDWKYWYPTLSYSDTGLTPNTAYSYIVYTFFVDGTTNYSDIVTATTSAAVDTPQIALSTISSSSINVFLHSNDQIFSGFNLTQTTPSGNSTIVTPSSGSDYANQVISGLAPKTKYCFTASTFYNSITSTTSAATCVTTLANDPATISSPAQQYSDCSVGSSMYIKNGLPYCYLLTTKKSVVAPGTPLCPAGYSLNGTKCTKFATPSVTVTATTSSAVTVSWKDTDSGITSYIVTGVSPSVFSLSSTGMSYLFNGLQANTKYCYTVTAKHGEQSSATSNQTCTTTKKATATGKNITSADTVTTSSAVTKDATTVSTDTTSSSVTIPVTTPADTTNTTSPGTTVISTVAPTVTTSCPAGYLKFGQTCKKLNSTVPVTKKYSCPTGYVFDAVHTICSQSTSTTDTTTATTTDSVSIASTTASTDVVQPVIVTTPGDTTVPVSTPTSAPAMVTYSCATSGYVLFGSQCTLTTTIPATAKKGCPTGYGIINQNCVRVSPPSIIFQTTTYSCSSGYTLNTDGTTCSSASVTVPATATYSCPTGSILDNATKTCTQSTSAAFATSTTTASVFDSITHWFGSFFGW